MYLSQHPTSLVRSDIVPLAASVLASEDRGLLSELSVRFSDASDTLAYLSVLHYRDFLSFAYIGQSRTQVHSCLPSRGASYKHHNLPLSAARTWAQNTPKSALDVLSPISTAHSHCSEDLALGDLAGSLAHQTNPCLYHDKILLGGFRQFDRFLVFLSNFGHKR